MADLIDDSVERLITLTLEEEGWPTFGDKPSDLGGPTKGGITLETFRKYFPGATVEDLKATDESTARWVYRQLLKEPHLDRIRDFLLLHLVYDCVVHHGDGRAVRWLQEAYNRFRPEGAVLLAVDGKLGDLTARHIRTVDPHQLALSICARRGEFMGEIVTKDRGRKRQYENAHGWLARVGRFILREAERGSCSAEVDPPFMIEEPKGVPV